MVFYSSSVYVLQHPNGALSREVAGSGLERSVMRHPDVFYARFEVNPECRDSLKTRARTVHICC